MTSAAIVQNSGTIATSGTTGELRRLYLLFLKMAYSCTTGPGYALTQRIIVPHTSGVVVGIDVGGPKKGFHAVTLKDGRYLTKYAASDPKLIASLVGSGLLCCFPHAEQQSGERPHADDYVCKPQVSAEYKKAVLNIARDLNAQVLVRD